MSDLHTTSFKPFIEQFSKIRVFAPYFSPYAVIHRAFAHSHPLDTESLAKWLNLYFEDKSITPCLYGTDTPLKFVAQEDLPHGTAYEQHILATARIPTRNNLHDWFGACVWSVFPKSKALLNAKHMAYLHEQSSGNGRNRVRDAITVFDENGAILVVADDLMGETIATSLAAFDWQTCLVSYRKHWHNPNNLQEHTSKSKCLEKAQVFIFGHALLEQLINPYKSLCSHTLCVRVPGAFFALDLSQKLSMLDELLCQRLEVFLHKNTTPKDLNPLPILGVPYFWDNVDPQFYQDEFVFRKGRKKDA